MNDQTASSQTMKKLLLVTPEYPPYNTGGGGIAYQSLAETFHKRGYDVTVLSAYHLSTSLTDKPKVEELQGIHVHRLPLIPNFLKSAPFNTRLPLNKASKEYATNLVTQNMWPYILIPGGLDFIGPYAGKIAKQNNIPYFIHVHGVVHKELYSLPIRLAFSFFENQTLKPFYENARRVFFLTKQNIPWITDYDIIPNGIFLKEFRSIKEPVDIRKKHQIPPENTIIFSIGRIEERKGYQFVINAIKDIPQVTYVIAGIDSGYQKQLQQIITQNQCIVFTGQLSNEIKKNYYQQADVVAIPSLMEQFPMVGLEAMAFGKAIVANPVGGLKDYLQHDKNAILSPVENEEPFKADLIRLISDPKLRDRLGKQAREDVEQYTWDMVVNTFEREISQALKTQ